MRARSSGTVRASSWRWNSRAASASGSPAYVSRIARRIAAIGPELRRLLAQRGDQLRVELVLEDHVLLRREVAEERARRDLRGVGDLLDGRRVVALLGEQAQGVRLDRRSGSSPSSALAVRAALVLRGMRRFCRLRAVRGGRGRAAGGTRAPARRRATATPPQTHSIESMPVHERAVHRVQQRRRAGPLGQRGAGRDALARGGGRRRPSAPR